MQASLSGKTSPLCSVWSMKPDRSNTIWWFLHAPLTLSFVWCTYPQTCLENRPVVDIYFYSMIFCVQRFRNRCSSKPPFLLLWQTTSLEAQRFAEDLGTAVAPSVWRLAKKMYMHVPIYEVTLNTVSESHINSQLNIRMVLTHSCWNLKYAASMTYSQQESPLWCSYCSLYQTFKNKKRLKQSPWHSYKSMISIILDTWDVHTFPDPTPYTFPPIRRGLFLL